MPVAFEVTVLFASVLSVAAMIVIYFRFPNNAHPLHDTSYMKQVSSDSFGICIEASDPLFDEEKVVNLLKSLGGKEVSPVDFDIPPGSSGIKLLDAKFVWILLIVAGISAGTTYFVFNHLLYMEPFTWMSDQVKLKAQEPTALFSDGIGMREPAHGTVARGHMPYLFTGAPDSAARHMINPYPVSKDVLEKGQKSYRIFCSPCHGNFGRGDSRLRGQFPNPPTLHSDKVRNWSDGRIYHIISEGQNVMPGYPSQIPREDRWEIVHYVRALQRAHNAGAEDMK